MSVPADKLMELMRGSRSAGAAMPTPPAAAAPVPGEGAPMSPEDNEIPPISAPMSTPEPKMGSKEAALINIGMAMDLLEQSLPALGPESEEAKKALDAIRSLTSVLGPRKGQVNELQQAEILQMLQSLPQAGGATPEGRALAQAPVPGMPPAGGMPQPTPM
jgi:hypothetical protein